nr:uncharacterized protein LOC117277089 [Nicotiana tomentosiformis]
MEEEAENFVARCDKCQRYANNMHRPAELLHSGISPCPFMKWGMDIVGPFPQAKEEIRFLLVLTDYFSKWVEAEALIPVEIGEPSTRYTHTTEEVNKEELRGMEQKKEVIQCSRFHTSKLQHWGDYAYRRKQKEPKA